MHSSVAGKPREPQPWEAAYARFESDEEEIRKFLRRLRAAGAEDWPRQWSVADLFCGRGNGLHALRRLGFERLVGVDLSARLLARYRGPAELHVGDCRALGFSNNSLDAVTLHGGLHHLTQLPGDLDRVLGEVRRVLRPNGRLLSVEPWQTPFLALVHGACRISPLRRVFGKLDSLAQMIELEQPEYPNWLAQPALIEALFERHFIPVIRTIGWGKRLFVGAPRPAR